MWDGPPQLSTSTLPSVFYSTAKQTMVLLGGSKSLSVPALLTLVTSRSWGHLRTDI